MSNGSLVGPIAADSGRLGSTTTSSALSSGEAVLGYLTTSIEKRRSWPMVMTVMRVSNDAKCLCFLLPLSGSTEEWFKKLKPGSVDSWNKLQVSLQQQFVAVRKINLEFSVLTHIKQLPAKTLKNFIKRFKEEASKTKIVDDRQQLSLLQVGIRTRTPFWNELQQDGAARSRTFKRESRNTLIWKKPK
uniref:Retrotransposon gag domain-containing protein n=1 Tax=Cannabis sativa TaxID=3483 RepID=A0A803PR25_CANSA